MRTIFFRVLCASMMVGAIWVCSSMTLAATKEPIGTQRGAICEESASTRHALHELRDDLPMTEAVIQERRRAIGKLIEQNPDDVFLHLDYLLDSDRGGNQKTATIARYKKLLDEHT